MTTPSQNSFDNLAHYPSERRRVRLNYRNERLPKAPFVLVDRDLAWNLIESSDTVLKVTVRPKYARTSLQMRAAN